MICTLLLLPSWQSRDSQRRFSWDGLKNSMCTQQNGRGRPRETWRRCMEREMKDVGMTWVALSKKAQDRDVWRMFVCGLYPDRGERQWWWWHSKMDHDNKVCLMITIHKEIKENERNQSLLETFTYLINIPLLTPHVPCLWARCLHPFTEGVKLLSVPVFEVFDILLKPRDGALILSLGKQRSEAYHFTVSQQILVD